MCWVSEEEETEEEEMIRMARKFKFVFVASKRGDALGRLVKLSTLERARESRARYKLHGWTVSRISKTSKV